MSVNSVQALQADPTQVRKATKSSASLGDFLAAVMQTQTSEKIKAASSDQAFSPPQKTSLAMPMPIDGLKPPSWEGLFPQPEPKAPDLNAPMPMDRAKTPELSAPLPVDASDKDILSAPLPVEDADKGDLSAPMPIFDKGGLDLSAPLPMPSDETPDLSAPQAVAARSSAGEPSDSWRGAFPSAEDLVQSLMRSFDSGRLLEAQHVYGRSSGGSDRTPAQDSYR